MMISIYMAEGGISRYAIVLKDMIRQYRKHGREK
jgi:hypothetical protein